MDTMSSSHDVLTINLQPPTGKRSFGFGDLGYPQKGAQWGGQTNTSSWMEWDGFRRKKRRWKSREHRPMLPYLLIYPDMEILKRGFNHAHHLQGRANATWMFTAMDECHVVGWGWN